MELELKNLIDKKKKEGVDEAQKDADNVIKEAKGKAKKIIEDAEKRKADILKEAQTQAQHFRDSSEKALKQAARDVLLTLRERVTDFFQRVVKGKVSAELTPGVLKEVIIRAVENFRKDGVLDIEVLVSEKDRNKLKIALFSALSQEAKKHLTLKSSKGIEKGFRIGEKGKDSYFDFTGEAITESFARYLNPKLREILNIDKKT